MEVNVLRNPSFKEVITAVLEMDDNQLLFLSDAQLAENEIAKLEDNGIAVIAGEQAGRPESRFYCLTLDQNRDEAARTVNLMIEKYFPDDETPERDDERADTKTEVEQEEDAE
jgi:hypothetical protein